MPAVQNSNSAQRGTILGCWLQLRDTDCSCAAPTDHSNRTAARRDLQLQSCASSWMLIGDSFLRVVRCQEFELHWMAVRSQVTVVPGTPVSVSECPR